MKSKEQLPLPVKGLKPSSLRLLRPKKISRKPLISSVESEVQAPITPKEVVSPSPVQTVITTPVTPPPAPATISTISPDTGTSDSDLLTNATQLTITGQAIGADSVELQCNGNTVQNVPVGSDSKWSSGWTAPAGTVDGAFNFVAYSIKSGVTGSASEPLHSYP